MEDGSEDQAQSIMDFIAKWRYLERFIDNDKDQLGISQGVVDSLNIKDINTVVNLQEKLIKIDEVIKIPKERRSAREGLDDRAKVMKCAIAQHKRRKKRRRRKGGQNSKID